MSFLGDVLVEAFRSLSAVDLRGVLGLTLVVTGSATVIAVLAGVPLGVWTGRGKGKGRTAMLIALNTGMGMPPVLAGLVLLLLLWDDGPAGGLDLLFTPVAMIAAQSLLATPIVGGIVAGAIRSMSPAVEEHIAALRLSRWNERRLVLREVWPAAVTSVAAAFGRVTSEVGAVLIVGGNIRGETRVLTTAIVQESRQGRLGAALGFGLVLLVIALAVNLALTTYQLREARRG